MFDLSQKAEKYCYKLQLWPIILDTSVNTAVSKQKQLFHFNKYCKLLKLIIHVLPTHYNQSLNYQVHFMNVCVTEFSILFIIKKSTKFQDGRPPQFTTSIKINSISQFIHKIKLKGKIDHTQNTPSKHLICIFCDQYQLLCKSASQIRPNWKNCY